MGMQRCAQSVLPWIWACESARGTSFRVGLHFRRDIGLQTSLSIEWKVDLDMQNDTHRHLSHLIGLYPGYAITNYEPAVQGGLLVNGSHTVYTKAQVMDAATVSLIHRGNGTGPDADSGWEKMCMSVSFCVCLRQPSQGVRLPGRSCRTRLSSTTN